MSDKKTEPYYLERTERYLNSLERKGYLSNFAKGSNRKHLIEYTAALLQLQCQLSEKIGALAPVEETKYA